MKTYVKNIFAFMAVLFMMAGVNAYASGDHKCKCPNKETCCVDKEHCATCPDCMDCCKDGNHCTVEKGKACAHNAKAESCNKDGKKDCCKGGKKKGKKGNKA